MKMHETWFPRDDTQSEMYEEAHKEDNTGISRLFTMDSLFLKDYNEGPASRSAMGFITYQTRNHLLVG